MKITQVTWATRLRKKKEKLKILTSKKNLNALRFSLETERHISLRDTDEEDENQNFVSLRLSFLTSY